MEAADVDGNGSIDYIEFISATMHRHRLERDEHLYKAFQYFDKDSSGVISYGCKNWLATSMSISCFEPFLIKRESCEAGLHMGKAEEGRWYMGRVLLNSRYALNEAVSTATSSLIAKGTKHGEGKKTRRKAERDSEEQTEAEEREKANDNHVLVKEGSYLFINYGFRVFKISGNLVLMTMMEG
ncbi:hypothetical protein RIF29_18803 [Crotalaria pallida]|uniref:EF-hand domain-containing protein n=1 Tax=Crotalaria pallida TaxID=3830 RepID=A0AAN9F0T8_CROPI